MLKYYSLIQVLTVFMLVEVVTVTKKGQATIPKKMREKYGIKDKVLVVEAEEGIILKPLPAPDEDFGSLKDISEGKTSRELLEEARREESAKERERMRRAGTAGLRL